MSGTEETYHMTKEDIKKSQSDASKVHAGNVPAGSEAAMMQASLPMSIIDEAEKEKPAIIAERQANLPLPEAPPGKSDFASADQRTVNVGSGKVATGNKNAGGREGEENLPGMPNDAVARDSKDKAGLANTTK